MGRLDERRAPPHSGGFGDAAPRGEDATNLGDAPGLRPGCTARVRSPPVGQGDTAEAAVMKEGEGSNVSSTNQAQLGCDLASAGGGHGRVRRV